jgi:hypothetical protein
VFFLSMYSSRGRLRNQVIISLFDCDESLTCYGLNSNLRHFGGFYLYLGTCGESRLLVLWCVGDRCDMVGSDKNHDRSRRPGAEDRE